MVTSLQLQMTSSFTRPSTSLPAFNRQCFGKTARVLNSTRIPMPPMNPKCPFPSKPVSVPARSRGVLSNRPSAQANRGYSRQRRAKSKQPQDLATKMFQRRIVVIAMPLVPPVTELIVAELIYLQLGNPRDPVYILINSTGTTRADGEVIALETEGFAIYDTMRFMRNKIVTAAYGCAVGQACLLLAAGTKGSRYMGPAASAVIKQPRVPPSGLMPACDVQSRAEEAIHNRDVLVGLLAQHTGHSFETVEKKMRGGLHMNAHDAREFSVIDKIMFESNFDLVLRRGHERFMTCADGKAAGVQTLD